MTKTFHFALLATTLLGGVASAQDVTLTIESWRNDDLTIWHKLSFDPWSQSTESIKPFRPSPLAITKLQIPCGHIVSNSDSPEILQSLINAYVLGKLANN